MTAATYRGVVEGFYGPAWSHEQRLRGVEHFAGFGFNTYVIAPKDDPAQRLRWREGLAEPAAKSLRELIEAGRRLGVDVTMSVSPGLDVVYSSLSDRQAVLERFLQQLQLGAEVFVLLWDDIDWDLRAEEDIARYCLIEDAQAEFSNAILAGLRERNPRARLLVCPMIYNGRGPNASIEALGDQLEPGIELMWTGREVRSPYLDLVDAQVFAADAGRAPLYWDNFPVNNLSMRFELHMGALTGRAADLFACSRGLLANPMNQFECSLLPLATVGDYLAAPEKYAPEESWERSFTRLFGRYSDASALRAFFRCLMSSPLSMDAAPDLRSALGAATAARRAGDRARAVDMLRELSRGIHDGRVQIAAAAAEHPGLSLEISPWLAKYDLGGNAIAAMADFVDSGDAESRRRLVERSQELDANRYLVFGDVLDGAIAELLAELR